MRWCPQVIKSQAKQDVVTIKVRPMVILERGTCYSWGKERGAFAGSCSFLDWCGGYNVIYHLPIQQAECWLCLSRCLISQWCKALITEIIHLFFTLSYQQIWYKAHSPEAKVVLPSLFQRTGVSQRVSIHGALIKHTAESSVCSQWMVYVLIRI